jgi:hypothetical protein
MYGQGVPSGGRRKIPWVGDQVERNLGNGQPEFRTIVVTGGVLTLRLPDLSNYSSELNNRVGAVFRVVLLPPAIVFWHRP